jgi:hypothetical protein
MNDDASVPTLPDGDYAIVEQLGHRTFVGRVAEVDRFGTKMLQIEAIFRDELLPAVLIGGSTLFQFTPCSREVAAKRAPVAIYNLPPAVAAIVPPTMLPAPKPEPATDEYAAFDPDEDDRPF